MEGSHWAVVLGVMLVAACGGGGQRAGRSQDTGGMAMHIDSGGTGMRMDTGGMRMGRTPMQGMQMMPQIQGHMDSMMRASPQQMQSMMAEHEAMMSRMLDGMGADMRGMNMSASPEWSALTDSVKEDLAELPNLKGEALATRMRAHADRVKRLLAMHEQMMGK